MNRCAPIPSGPARHACKRIFALALMIHDGRPLGEVTGYLAAGHGLSATPLRCSARTRRL
jgi:hypothetical protein